MKRLVYNFLMEQEILRPNEVGVAVNSLKSVGNEIILSGNRLGLIMLADYIVEIAMSKNGSHIHLDEENFFDIAKQQLIVELKEDRSCQ